MRELRVGESLPLRMPDPPPHGWRQARLRQGNRYTVGWLRPVRGLRQGVHVTLKGREGLWCVESLSGPPSRAGERPVYAVLD